MVVLCLLLTGCGSKVNKANYDKITTGITEKEVEAILGPGEEKGSAAINVPAQSIGGVTVSGMATSSKAKLWKDWTKLISITFVDGKVMGKAQNGL